jgi:dTDP-4-dehydrorhamnose 3,5-epimerase
MLWSDATLAIQWPVGIQPILSAKDAQGKPFNEAEMFA